MLRRFLARRALKAFAARYDYDVSYMEHMLRVSPAAFSGFAGLTRLARHREAAPREAFYAAKLVGALAEDCGPCVQLVVRMAQEAGVADTQIEAVLTRERDSMTADTRLGFRFADAVAKRAPEATAAREAVRRRWGEAGMIDLVLALQIGRIFPMVKAGLGFAETCQRVSLGARQVEVAGVAGEAA